MLVVIDRGSQLVLQVGGVNYSVALSRPSSEQVFVQGPNQQSRARTAIWINDNRPQGATATVRVYLNNGVVLSYQNVVEQQ
jgi:hypothetical protein